MAHLLLFSEGEIDDTNHPIRPTLWALNLFNEKFETVGPSRGCPGGASVKYFFGYTTRDQMSRGPTFIMTE